MKFREFKLRKDPKCPVCGPNPTITELIDYEQFCGIPQAKAAEDEEAPVPRITAPELKAKLDRGDNFVLHRCARAVRVGHLPHPRLEPDPARPASLAHERTR